MISSPLSATLPPLSWEECRQRGWNHLDILLVTGDAYVDHPSFGVALICRLLESQGYKVAILSQPRYDSAADFQQYPTPLLFCGISAGNLDSIVANYSSNGKVRTKDSYSSNGNPWRGSEQSKKERLRPDRASLLYTSLAKSAYSGCPIVLGGIEASLRRFVHYDYKQEKLRASILTDAKADILVFGMGERAITEIAQRCIEKKSLNNIAGTCQRLTTKEVELLYPNIFQSKTIGHQPLILPSWQEIQKAHILFLEAELAIDKHARADSRQIILQQQQSHWVLQNPSAKPLRVDELDQLYTLPYTRTTHKSQPNIPALEMIKDSVTIVRGCSGNCSFCAITRHQGAEVISRSHESIVNECLGISQQNNFHGTISDLGGPTANLYGTRCKIGSCQKRDCLFPKLCANLEIDEECFIHLLDEVSKIKNIAHVFISSGLRMELLLQTPRLMEKIILQHTPGALKIAPEHTDNEVLKLMHKEDHQLLVRFMKKCQEIAKKSKKPVYLSPYIITAHPGSTVKHAQCLAQDLKKLNLEVRAFQDFTPTPGTISTAMYFSECDAETKKKIFVPKNSSARKAQRSIIEKELLSQQGYKKGIENKKLNNKQPKKRFSRS